MKTGRDRNFVINLAELNVSKFFEAKNCRLLRNHGFAISATRFIKGHLAGIAMCGGYHARFKHYSAFAYV